MWYLLYLYWPNINSISNIKSESRETYEDVPNGPVEVKDTTIETEAKETDKENVIQVKEYSSPKDDDNDIVFVKLPSWWYIFIITQISLIRKTIGIKST